MKITLQTPTAVTFREPGIFGYAAGTLLALAGATIDVCALALGGASGLHSVALAVGAGLAAIGIWAARRTAATTFTFDRDQRALVIVRRRLAGGTTMERYPLGAVDDVVLEESRTSKVPTYRVAIRFADGRTMPCTFYYSGGREPKAEMVNAVRAVLSRADGREREPVTTLEIAATSPPTSLAQLRSARTVVYTTTLICAVFVAVGAWLVGLEWVRLARWVPAPATVLDARVVANRNGSSHGGTTYAPRITYRYAVNGRAYTSRRVTPLSESRGGEWAWRIASRYVPGRPTTAWYDPGHPEQAYLVHEWTVFPFVFIVFPLGALAFVRWAARRGVVGRRRGA